MIEHDTAGATTPDRAPRPTFDDDLNANRAVEKRLIWKELAGFGVVAAIVVVRQLWLL